jgi:hypothetical protein
MWMMGLLSMSWIINDLKLKTEQGYLLDTHRSVGISHSDGNSFIPCRIDSKFHNDFYFDCLKII